MDKSYFDDKNRGKKAFPELPKHLIIILIFILSILSIPPGLATEKESLSSENLSLRKSILAGTWYPGNRKELSEAIGKFLEKAVSHHVDGKITGIIVPHAGYKYSGQVAAYAYKNLIGSHIKKVIFVGPSHRVPFQGVSVNLQKGYVTPLGVVPVDWDLAKKILKASPIVRWVKNAHEIEHSLEIQLPFLQTVLKDFSIVPVLMGQQDYETCSELANLLVKIMKKESHILLLASSDLSHYHPYERAKTLDSKFISYVTSMDAEGLYRSLREGSSEACGGGPVIATILTCRLLGAIHPLLLNYANSGDVTGDRRAVVGYMSALFIKPFDKDQHQ